MTSPWVSSPWISAPWAIALIALVVRLLYITLAHSYRFHPIADHFEFGWEMGRIGRSLALGRGFADPFVPMGTGPTAWLPPLYPLIIGAVFRTFGIYSPLSGWVLLAINSVFSAATIPAIFEIATRCFPDNPYHDSDRRGHRIALWSAWIWALYPPTMQFAVRLIWETPLTTFLITWALVIAFRLRGVGNPRPYGGKLGLWACFGLLWGLISLSNATPLLLLPVCVLWVLLGSSGKLRTLAGAAFAGAIVLACLAPWTLRNWQVFHAFIPVRGNLGAELWVHNGPGADGLPRGIVVFTQPELQSYATMGEVAYVRQCDERAREYIRSHPDQFFRLTLERLYFFWMSLPHPKGDHPLPEAFREATFALLSVTGWLGLILAVRRRITGASLFAAAFALLPLTYYFVTVTARFRHPLEPLLVILSVYLFVSADRSFKVFVADKR